MRPHHYLLAAVVLIGLGIVPRTGTAQGTGTSSERALYLTNDPTRATCLLPEEPEIGKTTGRCYIMECAANGDHCACPDKLPNGWNQPLTADQCWQLGQILRPLPQVKPDKAAAKERPKAPSPTKQVEKGRDEDRKLYAVRLQAQGGNVQESVVLSGPTPISVVAGLNGLEVLKGKLSRKELLARTDSFRRAERMIRNAPPSGVGPPGHSFGEVRNSSIRVDVEVIRGINFRE